jgi:monofunctional biosynthetic peptidoglycan transglycosylase
MAGNGYAGPVSAVAGKGTASRPRGIRRYVRIALRILLALVLIPVVLVPVYGFVPPPSTLMIYERLTGTAVERTWVSLDEIAPSLVASVLMSEDGKFCSHSGVDWDEISRVLDRNDERPRGASTIAMQTVKNLFLWPSRSYVRKAIEVPLALYADAVWGKRRMMEVYLNVVEWGPGVFGAEAASMHYFGRPAGRLTTTQSGLLAATLPNPGVRDPSAPTGNLSALARRIAGMARASGAYIGCLAG